MKLADMVMAIQIRLIYAQWYNMIMVVGAIRAKLFLIGRKWPVYPGRMSPMSDTQIYKISQMYTIKYPSKCIKIDHNCINHLQMYKNWPHLYNTGFLKMYTIKLTTTNGNLHLADPKCIQNQSQVCINRKMAVGWASVCLGLITLGPLIATFIYFYLYS